jgi:RND family efflux transporter MFP subunit
MTLISSKFPVPKIYGPIFAVAFCLAVMTGCSGKSAAPASAAGPQAMPVTLQVVRSVDIQDASEYVATLKSRRSSTISPQVEGQITHIFVKSGDHVAAGTPLMQIDPLKQQATVNSQESTRSAKVANLHYAQQQYERVKQLASEGVVSRQDLDQAQAAYESAQAELKALDATVQEQHVQLRYYKVASPMAGIVGDVPVRVGDRVTTSTVLTTVDEPGALEAYISVPIERASEIHPNQAVEILGSAGNVLADSRVSFISSEVNDQTQSVLVKALIDNKKNALRTAQFTRARIIWRSHQGPVVPVLSVSRVNGQFFAFTAESENNTLKARQKMIHVGDMIGNDYAVIDGVKAGDRLITSGTQFLVDGMPVKDAGTPQEVPKS